jgi:hypothetical protein
MAVIHFADRPEGLIQKCAICGEILQDYTHSESIGDWQPLWWEGCVEVGQGYACSVHGVEPNCATAQLDVQPTTKKSGG